MQDVFNEEFDVNPDTMIEDNTPQSALADDTPVDTDSTVPAEGLHFEFPSEEEISPNPTEERSAPEAYLPVYNGQPVRVDATDVERVTTLLREGMRFEQFKPQFEALRRMSVAAGYRRPEDLIEGLSKAVEADAYAALLEETGGNETLAQEVMEGRRLALSVAQGRVEDADTTASQSRAARLAAEYSELKTLCPDVPSFGDLPKAVVESAALNERSLTDAYLRFMQEEKLKADAAAKAAQKASAAATGSLAASQAEEGTSKESHSFESVFMARAKSPILSPTKLPLTVW